MSSETLYNEIATFLKSIQLYEKEIENLKILHPKWHINQILAQFSIKYPERMLGDDKISINKRKVFRKVASKYSLDINNRLIIKNQ